MLSLPAIASAVLLLGPSPADESTVEPVELPADGAAPLDAGVEAPE